MTGSGEAAPQGPLDGIGALWRGRHLVESRSGNLGR